jgi:hypothetical protein
MASPTTTTRNRLRNAIPKPPATVHLAVKAPPVRDVGGVSALGSKLTAASDANPTVFVNPPNIAPLKAALIVLAAAIVTAQGGTDAALTALLTASGKVRDLIKQHAAWVQGGANALTPADAVSFITLAGFQVAKKPQRATRSAPELSNGAPTVLHLEFPAILGAIMWFTEVSTDGGKTFARTVDTEHLKGDITGLTSGQTVTVRVRAYVRGSGYTTWTLLSIIVT